MAFSSRRQIENKEDYKNGRKDYAGTAMAQISQESATWEKFLGVKSLRNERFYSSGAAVSPNR